MELVAGATGSLGGKIVRELLRNGGTVRALARDPGTAAGLASAGAEVVGGNLRDPASLEAACRGVDTVISTASATRRSDDTPENVDHLGTRNLVDAARRAGVRRFVYVSTLGADPASPVPAFQAKGNAEAHLRASGLDWIILQPDAFMDVWFGMLIELPVAMGNPVSLIGESNGRHSFIAEADVARFAAAAARDAGTVNTTLALGGPAAVTFADAVKAYEAALGRSIPVERLPVGAMLPGLPESVSAIAAAFGSFESIVPMHGTSARYDVPLTSVEAFARERAAAGFGGA
ncbi:MAG TPA: SDR family oxidoreductase [Gemmatimonadales bacterium]